MKRDRTDLNHCAWEQILLWIPPRDIAAVAATCRFLRRLAAAITARRISDAARGLERHPIPFSNSVDSQPYSYFTYSRFPLVCLSSSSSSPAAQPWGRSSSTSAADFSSSLTDFISPVIGYGCECAECSEDECPCRRANVVKAEMEMVMECGAGCGCRLDCRNRVTQKGIEMRLRVIKHPKKGWGLHADQFVKKGEFVCEYAGEFLTTEEARKRQRIYDDLACNGRLSPALLVVREHLPSGKACLRVNIDATKVGNVARFINHSCGGGNLLAILVRNSGSLLPRLCFFAAEDITKGEELTFSYGESCIRTNGQPCYCGKAVCSGTLPSEET